MKPVKNQRETIFVGDITYQHIVVAVIENKPCILHRVGYETESEVVFGELTLCEDDKHSFTLGNGFTFIDVHTTPSTMVEAAIDLGYKIGVFEPDKWRDALHWLLNNVQK